MGWASRHIEALKNGETVQFRPHGGSMAGRVESGQLVTVAPCGPEEAEIGDVVLCRVSGAEYLHLVKAKDRGRCMIGNNRGRINGWTAQVFGRMTNVE